MTKAEVGQKAPDFKLLNQDGQEIELRNFNGMNVVLAFYPFDFSPVCTKEFGCFQDDLNELKNIEAQVFGISVDSKYCHKAFSDKLQLKFPLLSDFSKKVCKLYGTLRPEGFSNRAYFLIDKNRVIRFKKIMEATKDRMENKDLMNELKKL